MQLKREMIRIRLKQGESMASYLSRIKIAADYLQDAGSEMKDEDLAYAMLSRLPDSYDSLTMSLANLEDQKFTSIEIKKSLLMEYERRMSKDQDQEPKGEVSAYEVGKTVSRPPEHRKPDRKCYHCGKTGHLVKQCYQKKSENKNQTRSNQKESFILSINVNHTELNDTWLLDSATTHHVCKSEQLFKNLRKIKPEPVGMAETMVGQGQVSLMAEGIGDITLSTKEDNTIYDITPKYVYYVPKCKRNLLSVAQIEKKGKTVVMQHGVGKIMSTAIKKVVATAHRSDNLYLLQAKIVKSVQEEKELHPAVINERGIWHHRFCHTNNRSISDLTKKGYVRGLTDKMTDADQCYGCCMSKSTKMSCKKLDGKSSRTVLELLHSDVCGPMPVASEGGSRYFMTIIDDYSRHISVLFLKSKDEAANKIKEYIIGLERRREEKVKGFRSDNGLEYCNRTLQNFFLERGIKHERTYVETPQMNGVAVRANRTLLDMVRSMLTSAKLLQTFWAEAVAATAYVRNRMTHSNVNDGVPEGIWIGRQPSVRHLKVFGCLAYAHLLAQGKKKLDPRGRTCVFVGYSNRTKGYRL